MNWRDVAETRGHLSSGFFHIWLPVSNLQIQIELYRQEGRGEKLKWIHTSKFLTERQWDDSEPDPSCRSLDFGPNIWKIRTSFFIVSIFHKYFENLCICCSIVCLHENIEKIFNNLQKSFFFFSIEIYFTWKSEKQSRQSQWPALCQSRARKQEPLQGFARVQEPNTVSLPLFLPQVMSRQLAWTWNSQNKNCSIAKLTDTPKQDQTDHCKLGPLLLVRLQKWSGWWCYYCNFRTKRRGLFGRRGEWMCDEPLCLWVSNTEKR